MKHLKYTQALEDVMHGAEKVARRFHHDYVSLDHVMLAMILRGDGVPFSILKHLGVVDEVRTVLADIMRQPQTPSIVLMNDDAYYGILVLPEEGAFVLRKSGADDEAFETQSVYDGDEIVGRRFTDAQGKKWFVDLDGMMRQDR